MSSIITTDIIETETYARKSRKKSKEVSVISPINRLANLVNKMNVKQMVDNHKFTKVWLDRNVHYADVFTASLELDKLIFQQYVFVEDTKELSAKLERIGFVEQIGYPDEIHFKSFSRMMYNKEYNIALSLYKPQYKKAIFIANEIVDKAEVNGQHGISVFLSAIDVLISQ